MRSLWYGCTVGMLCCVLALRLARMFQLFQLLDGRSCGRCSMNHIHSASKSSVIFSFWFMNTLARNQAKSNTQQRPRNTHHLGRLRSGRTTATQGWEDRRSNSPHFGPAFRTANSRGVAGRVRNRILTPALLSLRYPPTNFSANVATSSSFYDLRIPLDREKYERASLARPPRQLAAVQTQVHNCPH